MEPKIKARVKDKKYSTKKGTKRSLQHWARILPPFHKKIQQQNVWCGLESKINSMGKKSHAPLFTLFLYFTHLVPPTHRYLNK